MKQASEVNHTDALKRFVRQPSVALVMGRGVGWRREVCSKGDGFYLHLGQSEVMHWKRKPGMRSLGMSMDGDNFMRVYLTGPNAREVQQAAADLRSLAPYNKYTGHGWRTWAEACRPRKTTKKAK